VNAYEVKAGMVCLQYKNCVIHTNIIIGLYLSASEVSFSKWGAIRNLSSFTFIAEKDKYVHCKKYYRPINIQCLIVSGVWG